MCATRSVTFFMLIFCAVAARGEPTGIPPNPTVVWTEDEQRLVAGGDATKGKELAERCSHCHGEDGIGVEANVAAYTYKQLQHYKADKPRSHNPMRRRVRRLSNQEMADLAAWYASLKPAAPDLSQPEPTEAVLQLVERGDQKREVTACAGCHGAHGEGAPIDTPALGGQKVEYFFETMKIFAVRERARDVFNSMCNITPRLTEEELLGLASYYARLGGRKAVAK